MTDTRLPDTWLLDENVVGLSDPGFRLLCGLLMYGNRQLSDGFVPYRFLSTCYPTGTVSEAMISELTDHGFISVDPETKDVTVLDWAENGQTLAANQKRKREGDAARKRRQRARGHPERHAPTSHVTVTRDSDTEMSRSNVTGDSGGQATDKDKDGTATSEKEFLFGPTGEIVSSSKRDAMVANGSFPEEFSEVI